ncbi:PKD-like family lipoprotein [Chitinophaga niabensis]|uniref:PKD-like family lipoprotein n=1 Tax=Chitinophaga niabensis TaxID=536979 RepID=UPI0031BBC832
MKANLTIICILTVLFSSCYKDKGNYTYAELNKLQITDTYGAVNVPITFGDTLKINPKITQTTAPNEENLTFEWMVFDNSPASSYNLPKTVIATTRNLAVKITEPPFSLGQNYRLTYKVTDKRTGVSSFLFYNLTIINKYAQGWMFLEDKAGVGDFSMILPNGSVERNVYSSLNAANPMGKPVKLEITPFQITDDLSPSSKKIYLLTETDGMELSYQTMLKKFNYGYLFYAAPSIVKPARHTWASSSTGVNLSGSLGVAINDGKLHTNLVGGFPGSKKWGASLLTPAGNQNYTLAPYVAGGTTYTVTVYDALNKRFYSAGGTVLNAFPGAASTVFDMNNVGMDLLYMDSANVVREYNCVFKDETNTPWLLKFKTVATTAAPAITLLKTQMSAPDIVNMTAAASSTLTPHIYYGVGNKLYKYETTSNITVPQFTFPAGETVIKMKFNRVPAGTSQLVAVTWTGTESKVYFFDVSAVGDFTTYTNVYSGFARIVDLGYKVP